MTSTGNDRAGASFGTSPKAMFKSRRFLSADILSYSALIWSSKQDFHLKKKQWSFDWTWKDCLVTGKGPGRSLSCQQLVKMFCPHCRRKKWLYWQFSTFMQNYELFALFPVHLLIDDLWKLNCSVDLYLWFHEQITDNSTIVLISTSATGSVTLQTCKSQIISQL